MTFWDWLRRRKTPEVTIFNPHFHANRSTVPDRQTRPAPMDLSLDDLYEPIEEETPQLEAMSAPVARPFEHLPGQVVVKRQGESWIITKKDE